MPDLHDWISQQIDEREALARRAVKIAGDWTYALQLQRVLDRDYVIANTSNAYGPHIAANDPAAVLRRCAADRKILAIHRYAGGNSWDQYACHGCGYDDTGYLVDHTNDCETLQALAEGYGLTEEELAGLDRPEQERQASPGGKTALQVIDEFLWAAAATRQSTTPTTDVPAALRGPNWKAKR
jgi:hypothetical protein